ncbi:hypothetical protein GCM10009557_46730 [Virgisporangium ochraceum]
MTTSYVPTGSSDLLVARFAGGRSGTEVMTWGQQCMWIATAKMGPANYFLNMRRLVPLSVRAGIRPASVATAVGELMGRYEALRTRYSTVDGEFRQTVTDVGELALESAEADGTGDLDAVADTMCDRMWRRPFDYDSELPLRAGVVTRDGIVRRIALVFSHLSVDGYAIDLLLRDLRLILLRGRQPAFTGWHPLDLARAEATTRAAANARAVRYWADRYRVIPPTMFPEVAGFADPPFQRYLLSWPALDAAVRELGRRHRTNTSTVLLAATVDLVGRLTGHDTVAAQILVSNRSQPGHDALVGTLVEGGLLVVDVADRPPLADLIPRTWQGALRAYRNAYYAPVDREDATDRVSAERGTEIEPYCCFNDMRQGGDDSAPAASVDTGGPPVLVVEEPPKRMHCRFCVQLDLTPAGLAVRLLADTRYLPPDAMRGFLHELADRVVAAAS